jgi:hypothetical protein
MQLLELVVFNISIETRAVHGIGIVLVGNWAVLAQARVPGGDHTFLHDASMMWSGAVIVRVVSGKTPAADLSQGTIIFIMVGRVLVTFKAV